MGELVKNASTFDRWSLAAPTLFPPSPSSKERYYRDSMSPIADPLSISLATGGYRHPVKRFAFDTRMAHL